MLENLAKKLFDQFVLNTDVVGVQREDGRYTCEKVNINYEVIYQMLKKGMSLGTYQQTSYKNIIKWVCFDFDSKDKNSPSDELKYKYVKPFINKLDKLGINYLIEFSGRRGFHIWIFFNSVISKSLGYKIIQKLNIEIESEDVSKYGLDLFPQTPYGNNKYGKMVKIPLSKHRKGQYSYLISNIDELDVISELTAEIIETQTNILDAYKGNDIEEVLRVLNIEVIPEEKNLLYKKPVTKSEKSISLDDIKEIFLEFEPLTMIWKNISNGSMTHTDRLVMLGTLSVFENGDQILTEIFEIQSNYDVKKTIKNMTHLKDKYYPVTMWYLYAIYNKKVPQTFDDELTIADVIAQKLNIEIAYKSIEKQDLIKQNILSTVKKEINYLSYNDEVADVLILSDLMNFKNYDIECISQEVMRIKRGHCKVEKDIFLKTFDRKEGKKVRRMVSLGPYERVLSTELAIEFCKLLKTKFNSYSYHINLLNDNDVFIPWFSTWSRFQKDIMQYFKLNLFDDMYFIKIDLKNFYGSIYLHSLYDVMIDKIGNTGASEEIKNIFHYIMNFNEEIMRNTSGSFYGVPQGPAYARILAEFFISQLLEHFFEIKEYSKCDYKYLRYVDDIYLFHNHSIDSNILLTELSDFLNNYNLELNSEKSVAYGLIGEMNKELKESIVYNTNYDIKLMSDLELIDKEHLKHTIELFEKYLQRKAGFDINDANFILNQYIDPLLIKKYLDIHFHDILTSEIGRGSIFKKFYTIILTNSQYSYKFFNDQNYMKIPVGTINFKNFIAVLYKEIKAIYVSGIDMNLLKRAIDILDIIPGVDKDDKITIKALLNNFWG